MFGIFKAAKALYGEAKEVYRKSDTAWQELSDEFRSAGLNFEDLDTTIRQALQKEAMIKGTDYAFAQFIKITTDLAAADGTIDQLRLVYQLRREAFSRPNDG
jgi:hypothetical protein